jgi:hypothetical protein
MIHLPKLDTMKVSSLKRTRQFTLPMEISKTND